MKKYAVMFCAMLAMGALTVSCSSEDEAVESVAQGEGVITFDVRTETGFQSRAVNEGEYADGNNYTVQLMKGDEKVGEWKKSGLPVTTKVDAGTYHLKAFYGEDKAASTTSMYVEGVGEEVVVEANQEEPAKLSVVCKPVCAKVKVEFDAEAMEEYFSDYYIEFGTAALGSEKFKWGKDASDPVYLKVNANESVKYTITAKYKDTSIDDAVVNGTYTLSPSDGLTLKIAPEGDGGLGFKITINTDTNDHEQDIEVPSDWVTDKGE